MFDYIIVAVAFLGGLIVIRQGVQAFQGKGSFSQGSISRLILASFSGEQEDALMKVLGILRIALGVFFVAIGFFRVWTLF